MKHFALCMLALVSLFVSGCRRKTENTAAAVRVRTVLIGEHLFTDRTMTQGIVESSDSALLSSLIGERLIEMRVKEGDRFRKGDLLFRLDRRNLENRYTLASEMLNMAKERENTRAANLRVAEVSFEKAEKDFNRAQILYSSKAVSQDKYESAEVKYRTARLAVDQAKAALSTAKAEVKFASATLEIARKHLNDSDVFAPYDGIVAAKLKNQGEFCGIGTPVLKVESNAKKRIAVLVSGLHFPKTAAKNTRIALSFAGKQLCGVPVTVYGKTIDPVSRTFELKGDLPDTVTLPSGTLCDVAVIFGQRKNAGIPEESLLFRKDGKSAFYTVVAGKAKEISVTPGLTQNGFTELLFPGGLTGKKVIVSGHYFVHDGSPVTEGKK